MNLSKSHALKPSHYSMPFSMRTSAGIELLHADGSIAFDRKQAALSFWQHIPPIVRRMMRLRMRQDHSNRNFKIEVQQ